MTGGENDDIDKIAYMAKFPQELRKDLISGGILYYFHELSGSYEPYLVEPNGISSINNVEEALVNFHRSTNDKSFVTSCFTFQSPSRSPAGKIYEVLKDFMIYFK